MIDLSDERACFMLLECVIEHVFVREQTLTAGQLANYVAMIADLRGQEIGGSGKHEQE